MFFALGTNMFFALGTNMFFALGTNMFFALGTSPFKVSPQSCRQDLDTLVHMETTWSLNSRVLWPASTRTEYCYV